MLAYLVQELTPDARFFGAHLGLQLCDLTKDNPRAVAEAPAPGVKFGDIRTLEELCDALSLDLSLAHASEEDGRHAALRLRRASVRESYGCPKKETAERVRARLALSREARGLRPAHILTVLKTDTRRQCIGGGTTQQM